MRGNFCADAAVVVVVPLLVKAHTQQRTHTHHAYIRADGFSVSPSRLVPANYAAR